MNVFSGHEYFKAVLVEEPPAVTKWKTFLQLAASFQPSDFICENQSILVTVSEHPSNPVCHSVVDYRRLSQELTLSLCQKESYHVISSTTLAKWSCEPNQLHIQLQNLGHTYAASDNINVPTELSKIRSGHARLAIGFPVIFHIEIESTEQHFLLLERLIYNFG